MQIILASQSPRRRDLLTRMGVEFDVLPSDFDERLDDSRPPEDVAVELALGKARTVAAAHPAAVVIGSDNIVAIGDRQLGKVGSEAEALELFRQYPGQPVKVICSLAVVWQAGHIERTAVETSWLHFKPFNEAAVWAYLATGDYRDKAGGFGIQSGALPLIDRINGDYDTIIGLPTRRLASLLAELGIASHPVSISTL